jgi:hypothetical protein
MYQWSVRRSLLANEIPKADTYRHADSDNKANSWADNFAMARILITMFID